MFYFHWSLAKQCGRPDTVIFRCEPTWLTLFHIRERRGCQQTDGIVLFVFFLPLPCFYLIDHRIGFGRIHRAERVKRLPSRGWAVSHDLDFLNAVLVLYLSQFDTFHNPFRWYQVGTVFRRIAYASEHIFYRR